jgi:hypothetical protein
MLDNHLRGILKAFGRRIGSWSRDASKRPVRNDAKIIDQTFPIAS